jgi:Cd2+/Zn2+-exporting ATPase
VFDKTGTLTSGRFTVTELCPAGGLTEKQLLTLAAGAETYSNHPLAVSIREAAKDMNVAKPVGVTELAGRGVKADFGGGNIVWAGNAALLRDVGVDFEAEKDDATVVYVAVGEKYAGAVKLEDMPKKGAAKALDALKKIGVTKTVLLTGDRRAAAQKIGDAVGIDEVYCSLLPQEKVEKLQSLLNKKAPLFYVGDGINDAPVLRLADVGIAMGALGSDAAIEAADVVLMDDDPLKISKAIRLSKKCLRIVYENIYFAIGVKLLCLLLGALGIANMWLAIFADVGVMILAVLNAIRTLSVKNYMHI